MNYMKITMGLFFQSSVCFQNDALVNVCLIVNLTFLTYDCELKLVFFCHLYLMEMQYSLTKDVVSLLKKPKTFGMQFKKPPLVRSK